MMTLAVLMAWAAGAFVAIVGWELLASFERLAAMRAIAEALAPARAAGSDGRDASAPDRRRLTTLAIAVAAALGWSSLGPAAAVALAALGPFAAVVVIRLRQRRWRSQVNRDAAAASRAIADLLSSGHSLSGSIAGAAREGAVAPQTRAMLDEAAAAIAVGLSPDDALEHLRVRCKEGPWESIVAAIQMQRQSGGDLAGLLRELSADLDTTARAQREARAASAQARLTARIVLAMPIVGAAIFGVAAPTALGQLLSEPLPRALLLLAVLLQVVAVVAVRRVARTGRD